VPKYVYKCSECDEHFTVVHGMTERQEDCDICSSSDCLIRVPQMPHIKTSDSTSKQGQQQVGSKVIEAIKENSRILKEEKEKLSNQVYKNDN
jgi:putative FmdB family regulatory protein